MKVSAINRFVYKTSINNTPAKTDKTPKLAPVECDTVTFTSTKSDMKILRRLADFGITDMYTGKPMIGSKQIENMLKRSTFDLPLKQLIPIFGKFEDTMTPVTKELFKKMKQIGKKNPDIKLDTWLKIMYKNAQNELLKSQRPIFGELIHKACDMPEKQYNLFMELMKETSKRIAKDPVILPFSGKEFTYKLERAAIEIKSKNNKDEIFAVNHLITQAKKMFYTPKYQRHLFGRNKMTKQKKLEHQMRPEVLKQNIEKLNVLKTYLYGSVLNNNPELNNIFDSTNAKICGFPIVTPFKRKEFIYDMHKITNTLKNKNLSAEMTKIAHKLPTSLDSSSAFIVKYANDSPEIIGYRFLIPNVCSVEHIKPKINGGKNRLSNYGLCSGYINAKRSNTNFAQWVKEHPESYRNIPKYYNKLIELYRNGVFKKIGLDKRYITDFAATVSEESPKERPIILMKFCG